MTPDEYRTRLQRQRETIGRRLEAARANLVALEAEHNEIEVALRVHDRLTAGVDKGKGNGAAQKSTPSQEYTIFAILDGAFPKRLSAREICRIAKEQHGREIPSTSAAPILSAAKKEGKVVHIDGKWGAKLEDKPPRGFASPEAALE